MISLLIVTRIQVSSKRHSWNIILCAFWPLFNHVNRKINLEIIYQIFFSLSHPTARIFFHLCLKLYKYNKKKPDRDVFENFCAIQTLKIHVYTNETDGDKKHENRSLWSVNGGHWRQFHTQIVTRFRSIFESPIRARGRNKNCARDENRIKKKTSAFNWSYYDQYKTVHRLYACYRVRNILRRVGDRFTRGAFHMVGRREQ